MESNLALFESALQSGSKFAPEHAAEHLHRKKEGIPRLDPGLAVEGQSSGGNDAVDVGVVFQFLSPCMENAEESDLGAEMFGIASDLDQRFSAGTEQEAIDESFVLECKRRQ